MAASKWNLSNRRSLDLALGDTTKSRATRKVAEANVRLAQAALAKARIQESYTHLTAEFDGVVAERNCDPGNLVHSGTSGTAKPLLTLVRVDRLRVTVELEPHFAGLVQRGDPVEMSVDGVNYIGVADALNKKLPAVLRGDPKDFITGKITRISPIVDRPGGMRTAIIELENPKNRLVPGASIGARIIFNKTRIPDAMLVPQQCVVNVGGNPHVFIVRDGKAQPMPVTITSNKYDQIAEITGIQASDLIAVSNQGKLRSGTPIKTELIKDWQSLFRR